MLFTQLGYSNPWLPDLLKLEIKFIWYNKSNFLCDRKLLLLKIWKCICFYVFPRAWRWHRGQWTARDEWGMWRTWHWPGSCPLRYTGRPCYWRSWHWAGGSCQQTVYGGHQSLLKHNRNCLTVLYSNVVLSIKNSYFFGFNS